MIKAEGLTPGWFTGSETSVQVGECLTRPHAVADEKHGDLFLPLLPKYIADQPRALKAADDALELFKLYHLGVAEAMEKLH